MVLMVTELVLMESVMVPVGPWSLITACYILFIRHRSILLPAEKTVETLIESVMVLMETVMVPVGFYW